MARIYDEILERSAIDELMADGYTTEDELALVVFGQLLDGAEVTTTEGDMPKYHRYVDEFRGVTVWYDYGADYYFATESIN